MLIMAKIKRSKKWFAKIADELCNIAVRRLSQTADAIRLAGMMNGAYAVMVPMDAPADIFKLQRPKLFGIAYRMLGSRTDAEDVLQETYLRWIESNASELRSTEAWFVTVVTRLCIDRLRSAKAERTTYTGPWLPEPLVSSGPLSPDRATELANDISIALLTILERLAPEERAAFLLHEVFDFEYSEIAQIINKRQAACRQIVHRARQRVQEDRRRFSVSREAHGQLLEKFIEAASSGRREQIMNLLADEVRVTADSGGKLPSLRRILQGSDPVARLYASLGRKFAGRFAYRLAEINGEPGLLRYLDGKLESAQSVVIDGTQICEIYIMRNPDNLSYISAAL
jgi:RNA polymerase sigma-70 factor, ECF subfamily